MAKNPFKITAPPSIVDCMRSSTQREADDAAAAFAARLKQHRTQQAYDDALKLARALGRH